MRKIAVVFAAMLLVLAVASAASGASAASDPRVPGLQRQITALKGQLATVASALSHEIDLNTCEFTYQSHFNYGQLNLWAILIGNPPIQDTTPSDNGACSRVGIKPPTRLAAGLMSSWDIAVRYELALTRMR